MNRRQIWGVGVALALVVTLPACAGNDPRPGATNPTPSITPSDVESPGIRRPPPDPIELGSLPGVGLAIGSKHRTVLADLAGEVIVALPGFEVEGNPGSRGVWLQRGRDYFRLAPGRGLLIPVGRKRARSLLYDEGNGPDLRPPPGTRIKGLGVVGHWRFAYRSSAGNLLAQWSGECEVPTAYWVGGGDSEIITGGYDVSTAPESMALGWSPSNEAVVFLMEGYCSSGTEPPGIFLFSGPGDGRLLRTTPKAARVDMWGGAAS